ncbi:L-2,4-diaminobutyrate decarboxylase (siderophore biosynthesis protein) [Haloferax larsenii JCM 13917]|nr:aspartate aminotransferase family protein [Haloferax larsenii]ELZ79070.1 L-2,4-diaminobutyrate decarboxylase (siderophore biosynthesis protein) [Haloferax larsenii JCM 13917]
MSHESLDAPPESRSASDAESVDSLFLGSEVGAESYRDAIEQSVDIVAEAFGEADSPYTGASPEAVEAQLASFDCLPEEGVGLDETLDHVSEEILAETIRVAHPACGAHLHCPPVIPGLAAEVLLTAANQSLDSWDQSGAATILEQRMVETLAETFGYDDEADGVFTSGGTQSNFMGLLLARNKVADKRFDHWVTEDGLPPEADRLRILCSADAHFTAKQSAAQLGLGENAVVSIETDDEHRMSVDALDETLDRLDDEDLVPFALVGTAGTTDFGSIDPLPKLAARAHEHDLWFHVDAAYGGALAFSDTHHEKLAAIECADSIAVDFHKLFYQPISCGAFLLQDGTNYQYIQRHAAYLNPESDDEAGVPNLVSKSVQTTRRFDALKPYVTFRTLGRKRLAELVDSTLELASETAAYLQDSDRFACLHTPTLNAVVFRYVPEHVPSDTDTDQYVGTLNERIRDALLNEGRAVVARTEVDGVASLKFTLLNPRATWADVESLLDDIERIGSDLEATTDASR